MISKRTTCGAFEAKTHLSRLLDQVERGEQVVITRHGKPVAELIPIRPVAKPMFGCANGASYFMADDFDAPLNHFREYQ